MHMLSDVGTENTYISILFTIYDVNFVLSADDVLSFLLMIKHYEPNA